jgi:hypothetical protein
MTKMAVGAADTRGDNEEGTRVEGTGNEEHTQETLRTVLRP